MTRMTDLYLHVTYLTGLKKVQFQTNGIILMDTRRLAACHGYRQITVQMVRKQFARIGGTSIFLYLQTI